MGRYRKPRKQVDLSKLDPNSQAYWDEILRREGLGMSRGLHPAKVQYAWQYHDNDPSNSADDYSEDSQP